MQIKCWIYSDFSLNFPDTPPPQRKILLPFNSLNDFRFIKNKIRFICLFVYFRKLSVFSGFILLLFLSFFFFSFSFPPGARQAIDETKQIIRLAAGFCAY